MDEVVVVEGKGELEGELGFCGLVGFWWFSGFRGYVDLKVFMDLL